MIAPIFKDKALQNAFDEFGFVKIPLLTKQEIEKLISLFYTHHHNLSEDNFSASSFLNEKQKKQKSKKLSIRFLNSILKKYLPIIPISVLLICIKHQVKIQLCHRIRIGRL